jgi:hypothetical protein
MKNITNQSINEDINVIIKLLCRYRDAIWENQEGQSAHFDNQPKIVKLAMVDVRTGLCIALEAMKKLREIGVLEEKD